MRSRLGILSSSAKSWHRGGGRLPATARDAVLARATRLSADAQAVLEAIAVVPQRAEVWLLEALLGPRITLLDECLVSGMVAADGAAVSFRHELARLAIEERIAPHRRVRLHRDVLAALLESDGVEVDAARFAHHAEAADDGRATLEFARSAAQQAAASASHREAAAQYRRALRQSARLDPVERAEMLERFADECHVTAAWPEEEASLLEAIECHRHAGDKLGEGRTIRMLAGAIACKVPDPERVRTTLRQAIEVLKQLPPSLELAQAYLGISSTFLANEEAQPAFEWAQRARSWRTGSATQTSRRGRSGSPARWSGCWGGRRVARNLNAHWRSRVSAASRTVPGSGTWAWSRSPCASGIARESIS